MIRCEYSLNWFKKSHFSASKRFVYLNTTPKEEPESEGGRIQITAYLGSQRRSTSTGVSIKSTPGLFNDLMTQFHSAIPREGITSWVWGQTFFRQTEFKGSKSKDRCVDRSLVR